jgi:hypothetical protein
MVAARAPVAPPAVRLNVVGLTETPVTGTLAEVTVTAQLADFTPFVVSLAVTVMVVVPAESGVTVALRPLLPETGVTVATAGLLLAQVTFLFVALDGVMVAARLPMAPPAVRLNVAGLTVMPVTGTLAEATVTMQLADFTPFVVSLAVTVIVAVPAETGVTVALRPLLPETGVTVATLLLLLDQVTFLFVALDGVMVAARLPMAPPTVRDSVAGLRVMPVTGTLAEATVTVQLADFTPFVVSLAVTVTVAVPAETGATVALRPLALTVATAVLLLDQLTALFVASAGAMVAARLPAEPLAVSESVAGLRAMPVTGVADCVTVTAQEADLPEPSMAVTVIVAVPTATDVTVALRPLALTVATAELLLDQATFLFVALDGYTAALRLYAWPPTVMDSVAGLTVMAVTGCVTVTLHVAVWPSTVATLMTAWPGELPTTPTLRPEPMTAATASSLLVQETFLFAASGGNTVALRPAAAPPTAMVIAALSSVTPVVGCVTVTWHSSVLQPSAVVTVMVVVPGFCAATVTLRPLPAMTAMEGALLAQVTFLFVALAGVMVAVR